MICLLSGSRPSSLALNRRPADLSVDLPQIILVVLYSPTGECLTGCEFRRDQVVGERRKWCESDRKFGKGEKWSKCGCPAKFGVAADLWFCTRPTLSSIDAPYYQLPSWQPPSRLTPILQLKTKLKNRVVNPQSCKWQIAVRYSALFCHNALTYNFPVNFN